MVNHINKEQWKSQLKEDNTAVIIDVRTPGEWTEGIQPNAMKINIMDGGAFMSELSKLDKNKNYYVYCRSGNRSGQACEIMESQGFANTNNLLGGMMQWDGEVING